ncbi:MAG: OadG family protein [Leptospiraceae bacterium]|nr:OadG family protein [Leptospiraceae bacterium]MCP5510672.1 OadG family protein [Leptospiraceae bacterium]
MFDSIAEGLKLMVFGMSFVFFYLVMIIGVINLSAKLLRQTTKLEEDKIKAGDRERSLASKKISEPEGDEGELLAVISAAIHIHRNRV